MSGCRHSNVTCWLWSRHDDCWVLAIVQTLSAHYYDRVTCRDCGHWLPLGPSRDDSPAVVLEMRAAELASAQISYAMPLWMQGFATDEAHGWRDFTDDDKGGDCQCRDRPGLTARNWHSGYLARAIVNHTDDQGGE